MLHCATLVLAVGALKLSFEAPFLFVTSSRNYSFKETSLVIVFLLPLLCPIAWKFEVFFLHGCHAENLIA
jgi:hypothetical protein